MKRLAALILTIGLLAVTGGADDVSAPTPLPTAPAATQAPRIHFGYVDVFVDPQGKALACYEVEIAATAGNVKLTGVEGGEDVNFNSSPYYDPRALTQGERIIIGAYTLGNVLPTRKTRVARLMVMITGPAEPHYRATLRVAGSSDEKPIAAVVTLAAQSAPRRAASEQTNFERTSSLGVNR